MTRLALLAVIAIFLSRPVFAEDNKYNITPLEKAACSADAVRLCSHTYPDQDKLLDCLRSNVRSLSLVCSVAFKAGLKRRKIPL